LGAGDLVLREADPVHVPGSVVKGVRGHGVVVAVVRSVLAPPGRQLVAGQDPLGPARASPTLMLEKAPADSSARWFCTTVSASTAASPTTTIAAVEARISRWRSFVLPVELSSTSLVASTARSSCVLCS